MYLLYRTTNTVNGKYYVGVSNGNNKWYKGSGTALKNAIKKYGAEKFITEIIETFNTEQEAFCREKQVVNEDMISDHNCYNIKVGGKGGAGQKKTNAHKEKIAKSVKDFQRYRNHTGGRNPAMPFEETLKIYEQYGYKGGAEYLNLSRDAFVSRVMLAKKKLTSKIN